MAPWLLVTPSSRGIGLALTVYLLRTTSPSLPLVATTRNHVEGTKEMILSKLSAEEREVNSQRLDVRAMDFDDESTIQEVASYCRERYNKSSSSHLRTSFLIPGMLVPERSPTQISKDSASATLHLNLLTPLLLMKHFAPLLPKKSTNINEGLADADLRGINKDLAVIAFMSARVGSISDNRAGGWYSYRASKAGVNALVKSLDIYLRTSSGTNAAAIALHPGTVKTDLSREFWASTPEEKLFEPVFAAEKLCGVAEGLNRDGGGKCWDWKGEVIPP